MATINQLIKQKGRQKKKTLNKTPALQSNPQKKGVCLKIVTRTPRKPNSAIRKLALIRLSNKKRIYAYIPGEGHTLQEHSVVLVQGGRRRDLPGMKYKIIRGVFDLHGIEKRRNARSKYGTKKK